MRLVSHNLARQQTPPDEDAIAERIARFRVSPVTRHVIRPLMLTAVLLSLLTAVLLTINNVQNGRWFWLLPLLGLVALEAIYTTQWASHPKRLVLDHTAYRAAEIFLLLLFMRATTWFIFQEGALTIEQALMYLRNPLALFLTPAFIVGGLLTLITWRLAITLSRTFTRLDLSEFELGYYTLPLAVRKARIDDQPIQIGRTELVNLYLRLWLYGGIVLVVFVGLSVLDLGGARSVDSLLAIGRLGLRPAVLIALLVYFLGGFWLMSQARLAELNARWLINGVEKSAGVEPSWQRNSLLLLLLVAVIAAFIPVGPTLPIATILNYTIYALLFLVNLIFYSLTLLMALVLSLFGAGGQQEPIPPQPPPTPPTLEQQPPQPLSDTAAIFASSAFWSILVVVAIIALLTFLRERDERPSREGALRLWDRFKVWLAMMWAGLRSRAAAIQLDFAVRRARSDAETDGSSSRLPKWRFIRVNALSPRDQVRYFYLSTLKRADRQGVKRAESDTPLEFVDDLRTAWPDAEDELEELTDAFLWARYSPKPVEEEDAGVIKRTWKQVKANMRRKRGPQGNTQDSQSPPT